MDMAVVKWHKKRVGKAWLFGALDRAVGGGESPDNLFVFDLVSQPGRENVLRFSSGQWWR